MMKLKKEGRWGMHSAGWSTTLERVPIVPRTVRSRTYCVQQIGTLFTYSTLGNALTWKRDRGTHESEPTRQDERGFDRRRI